MKSKHTTFDFPIALKQHLGMIVFSSPDIPNTKQVPLPKTGQITPKFLNEVAQTIGNIWIENHKRIQDIENSTVKPPTPSNLRHSIRERHTKPFTPVTLAKILGVSAETIRRAVDSGACESETTVGGHRKIPFHIGLEYAEALGYKIHFDSESF